MGCFLTSAVSSHHPVRHLKLGNSPISHCLFNVTDGKGGKIGRCLKFSFPGRDDFLYFCRELLQRGIHEHGGGVAVATVGRCGSIVHGGRASAGVFHPVRRKELELEPELERELRTRATEKSL